MPQFVEPWARMTIRHCQALQSIGLATCGKGGARLAARLSMQTTRQTILRRIMDLPDGSAGSVVYLGIEDFAFRRGYRFGLPVDRDALLQRWWYFFEGSLGCIGILKQWLIRALYRALREESPALTRAHLEKAALPDAKWERMRADAQSGEAEFKHATEHNSYLSDLASLATFVPTQPDSAPAQDGVPANPANGTLNQQTPKRKRRPGESSPRRDQVGTSGVDRAATQCPFSGPIQLEAKRWLESAVQEVQCPTCGSVSKAKLKGSSVVIAPHPQRKSRPVRNVTRWAGRDDADWVIVEKKE
jgi:hypothetical protein